ncbi:hypothetical protein OIU77_017786 [Salix suchowensis]|uniref:Uncharacterized protein n=1 Tax=Salix suchowensis TaxID=1278906 RepID=A0ABQ8ZQ45_9ROSI|nr:hypothetical protein OIU77_017786 [Salix suchowensis]
MRLLQGVSGKKTHLSFREGRVLAGVSGKKTHLSCREGKVLAVLDIVVVEEPRSQAKLLGVAIQGGLVIDEQEVDIQEAHGIRMVHPAWLISKGELVLEEILLENTGKRLQQPIFSNSNSSSY